MGQKQIILCYRKVIDTSSEKQWDKFVFEDSYAEFRMQSQLFNQENKYTSFADIKANVKGAEQLHFLVSAAVTNYLRQLDEKVPDLADNLGRQFLKFNQYQFEIINSDVRNKAIHKVAVNFYSQPLLWHDTVGDYFVLSQAELENTDGVYTTHLFQIQPFVSIHSLKYL